MPRSTKIRDEESAPGTSFLQCAANSGHRASHTSSNGRRPASVMMRARPARTGGFAPNWAPSRSDPEKRETWTKPVVDDEAQQTTPEMEHPAFFFLLRECSGNPRAAVTRRVTPPACASPLASCVRPRGAILTFGRAPSTWIALVV